MPRQGYQNTFQPNTPIGASLGNIANALFAAQGAQQDFDNQQFRNDAYTSQAQQNRAAADKLIAETLGLNNQEAAIAKLDPQLQAMGRNTNAEQIAKGLQQIAETKNYNSFPVKTVQDFGALQAANQAKPLYDNGTNNTTFGLFDGTVKNEDNLLNKSVISYGNEGTEGGKSKKLVDDSVISLNKKKEGTESAQAGKYNAEAQKAKREKVTNAKAKFTKTYIGDDADGYPMFETVLDDVGVQITKQPKGKQKADKPNTATVQEINQLTKIINSFYQGDEEEQLGQQSKQTIVSLAAKYLKEDGMNVSSAAIRANSELANQLVPVSTSAGIKKGFLKNPIVPKTITTAQPKPQIVVNSVPRPKGKTDAQLIQEANEAIANGADKDVVAKRLAEMGVGD